jgi:ribosomal-protein-alanine N-acetyltransferase
LLKPFWEKGYATELAKAIIEWGVANLPVDSLIGVCEIDNRPSERVLRKVGMY